jgi:preprotein translocase subunit SecG
MTILINVLLSIYVVVSLLMLLVILMQRPKSEGLGAAFGGGVTENIFGAQTTNVLTRVTAWLAGIFFLLTFVLSILYAHQSMSRSNLRRELMKTEAAKPSVPLAKPAPSSAVGAPGTVTNPTPAVASPAAAAPPNAAEAAVGAVPAVTATASPNASPAPTSPAPKP